MRQLVYSVLKAVPEKVAEGEAMETLEKGKKAPIGTVSGEYKKVAEGEWKKIPSMVGAGKKKKYKWGDKHTPGKKYSAPSRSEEWREKTVKARHILAITKNAEGPFLVMSGQEMLKAQGVGMVSVGSKHPAGLSSAAGYGEPGSGIKTATAKGTDLWLSGKQIGKLQFDSDRKPVSVVVDGKRYPIQNYLVKLPNGVFRIDFSR